MSKLPTFGAGLPRILVLGAAGQLGQALTQRDRGELIGLGRADLDIADRTAVHSILPALRPDLVINAAAYTAVDRAESETARAFAINRDGAGHVAEICAASGVPLIHLSTDYVFDGAKRAPYREEDATAPLSVYGLSKAAGETLVRERHERSAVLRTSWLFAATGHNFVKTILKLARERTELRIVADQIGCPTAAPDLATAIVALGRLMLDDQSAHGIFHFAGSEPVSWHDFAAAILAVAGSRLDRRPQLSPIATTDYPTPAQRPPYSVLDCGKLGQRGIAVPSWRPGLASVIEQLLGTGRKDRRAQAPARSAPCPTFS